MVKKSLCDKTRQDWRERAEPSLPSWQKQAFPDGCKHLYRRFCVWRHSWILMILVLLCFFLFPDRISEENVPFIQVCPCLLFSWLFFCCWCVVIYFHHSEWLSKTFVKLRSLLQLFHFKKPSVNANHELNSTAAVVLWCFTLKKQDLSPNLFRSLFRFAYCRAVFLS